MKKNIVLLIKDNLKLVVIGVILAIVIVVAIIFIARGIKTHNDKKEEERKVQEVKDRSEDLEDVLTEMGKEWYEEFYYPQMKENVSRWKDTGVSSSLQNFEVIDLDGFDKKLKKFRNPVTDEKCDYEKTKVIVKPIEPYGKEDYEIEVEIECDFDDYE